MLLLLNWEYVFSSQIKGTFRRIFLLNVVLLTSIGFADLFW